MAKCVLTETKGVYSSTKHYYETLHTSDLKRRHEFHVSEKNAERMTVLRCTQWFPYILSRIFLPQGFPFSVSKDYLNYQIWDTLQKLFSGISRPISTISVMASLGVGNVFASVVAAVAIKNAALITRGCGKIFFTVLLSGVMDSKAKKYRLMADVVYNSTLFLDLTTPLFPAYMIPYVFCLSSFILSFVDVTGQCTRLAVLHHQSRANNSGDLSAKDNSQEEMLSLIAASIAVPVLFQLEDKLTLSIILFVGLAFCHLFCNYHGVSSLEMESLNEARVYICLKAFLKSGKIPTVSAVNRKEKVILGFGLSETDVSKHKIHMGYAFKNLININSKSHPDDSNISKAFDTFQHNPFVIISYLKKKDIYVLLRHGIQSEDVLEAYVRSVFLGRHLQATPDHDCLSAMDSVITTEWLSFRDELLSSGFHTRNVKLKCGDYRLSLTKN